MNQSVISSTNAEVSGTKSVHTLLVDRRNHATITGVEDVYSFQEQEIVLKIDSGEMIVTGENLHIAKLLLEEGQLNVDGHIDGIQYHGSEKHNEKRRFFRRLTQ